MRSTLRSPGIGTTSLIGVALPSANHGANLSNSATTRSKASGSRSFFSASSSGNRPMSMEKTPQSWANSAAP
ncbi:hypothetical protein [Saccharopolyspora sp. NPDC002686]|uniref:hypothetical protein n=1 Tax=Saccharopolyspora sp. NPDC002686 TaxID=3154541 RepID=UPI00332755A5